jgi:putative Holliday junction resolvase
MRVLGLDIGTVRNGVAVSDAGGSVASPLVVLEARGLASDIRPLARIVEDYEVEQIVVGIPLTLSGDEGPQAATTREVAEAISLALDLPVAYVDERLSSAEARRVMREAGMSDREQRGSVDKVAAAILLQGYLDSHAGEVRS